MTNLPVPSPRTATAGEYETGAFMNMLRDAINFLTNKPYAFVYQSAGQSVANNANTALSFDATVWDSYGGHSNTTNNTRYTAQVAGTYGVLCHAAWPQNSTGARQLEPFKNGTAYTSGSQLPATQSTNWTVHETYTQMYLAVGDYVEAWVVQMSGGALTANSGATPYQTYMQVEWLRN